MIQTEAGLKQTIEQLNRMYRVLEDLRRRMEATNPAQFKLFAEGPIDEIRKLRREVDEYLGIQGLHDDDVDAGASLGAQG